jgi:hypothetical protein
MARAKSSQSLIDANRASKLSKSIFWGVRSPQSTPEAVRQLVPEAARFPQAQKLIGSLSALIVNLDASSDARLDLPFHAESGSPKDTLIFSLVLQATGLLRDYQASNDYPDLASILEEMGIEANGSQVGISFSLTDDQLKSLIAHDTFSVEL